jgi:hypothetical protein
MSDTDIEKGSRGLEEVGRALEGMKVGIICLTPENLTEPWILYEAGALSKTLDAKTRVCTYLLAGLRKRDVKPPLALFQATESERDETRKLMQAVNKALEGSPVPENNLNDLFDAMWSQLEKQLVALPTEKGTAAPKRPLEDMVAEVLQLSRNGMLSWKLLEQVREEVHEIGRMVRDREAAEVSAALADRHFEALRNQLSALSAESIDSQKMLRAKLLDDIKKWKVEQITKALGGAEETDKKKRADDESKHD